MIDLTGLMPLCDVRIGVCSTSSCIKIYFTNEVPQPIRDGIEALKPLGCLVYEGVIGNTERRKKEFSVFPGNYDLYQIAERLAMYFESTGLKVERLISDKHQADQSPKLPVQSFILA